jgi:predicted alpha/beta superfamily hydrolase
MEIADISSSTADAHSMDSIDSTPLDSDLATAEAEGRYMRLRDWSSRYLHTSRDLFVYLPRAYAAEPQRQFPVLILHDGQNLFDGNLSYVKGSTWRAGANADHETARGRMESTILVGVANAGVERMAEYTPTPDRKLGGGRGSLYARLLVEDLLPMLREDFRILPGAEATGIAGSSLGGLISLSIALRHPDVFGRVGVLSPSIWWDNRTLLKAVRSLPGHLPLRVWLDIGTAEGLRHVRDADLLAQLLEGKGWRLNHDLHYQRYTGAVHSEEAWASRFGQVLRFLFPAAG